MGTAQRHETQSLAFVIAVTPLTRDDSYLQANKKFIDYQSLAPTFDREALENATTMYDFGKHQNGVGLKWPGSSLGFGTYPKGVGKIGPTWGAGNGSIPVVTAFIALLAACLGGAPVYSTGSLVDAIATTPTLVAFTEDDPGNHGVNQMVGIADGSGGMLMRPISAYATDLITLGVDLPSAPSEDDIIYGTATIAMSETCNVYLQGDLLGTDTVTYSRNYDMIAMVGNFTLPETAVNAAQVINFELKVGDFTRYVTTARGTTTSQRNRVSGGGEFLLLKYGETAALPLKFLNVGVTLGRDYADEPDGNDTVTSLCGWVPTAQETEVVLYVHHNSAVPTGFSGSNFYDIFGGSDDGDDHFHLLLAWGSRLPGRVFSLYFKALQLAKDPEPMDLNGLSVQKLTFNLVQGVGGEDKILAGCA